MWPGRTCGFKRFVLFFTVSSCVLWIFLGLYFVSIMRKVEEEHRYIPNLLIKKHSQSADNRLPTTAESAFEKLKRIHVKKMNQAGIKISILEKYSNFNNNNSSKSNSILEKLKMIHQKKMNKAGFNIETQEHNFVNTDLLLEVPDNLKINYNVHIFYYPWYGNPEKDGQYFHWNHRYIQHWDKLERDKWQLGFHKPPEDIGSNYYPLLGLYSSQDVRVVNVHMKQIKSCGAGVIVVSWYPKGMADSEGKEPDRLMLLILDTAQQYNLKVTFHIEPYSNRNHITLKSDLKYIMDSYGKHPALYKMFHKGKYLPVYYIYDSYLLSSSNWSKIFKQGGSDSVRNTILDGIFIGLLVQLKHKRDITNAGFDGFYTYFASDGFTYGSSWKNWQDISTFAKKNRLLFIPSVGPGYIDTHIRPWNAHTTKDRDHGRYYESSFKYALEAKPPLISITSFNEWHEGTQIEPAVPKHISNYEYEDYQPEGPYFYLDLTRKFVDRFSQIQNK